MSTHPAGDERRVEGNDDCSDRNDNDNMEQSTPCVCVIIERNEEVASEIERQRRDIKIRHRQITANESFH